MKGLSVNKIIHKKLLFVDKIIFGVYFIQPSLKSEI